MTARGVGNLKNIRAIPIPHVYQILPLNTHTQLVIIINNRERSPAPIDFVIGGQSQQTACTFELPTHLTFPAGATLWLIARSILPLLGKHR